MAVTIMCPNLACRAIMRVPDQVRGKKVRCGRCGTAFAVPQQQTANAPPVNIPGKTKL